MCCQNGIMKKFKTLTDNYRSSLKAKTHLSKGQPAQDIFNNGIVTKHQPTESTEKDGELYQLNL